MSATPGFDDFLAELGADLIRSSQTVDDVERQLTEIAHTAGVEDLDVVALPTAVMLESGASGRLRSRLRSIREPPLRLDQVEAVDDLARRARLRPIDPVAGLAELAAIRRRRAPFGRITRSGGLGVLAAGFSLALQPTVAGLVLALLLGTAVGFFTTFRLAALAAITPTLVTFGVALAVFALDDVYRGDNPIRLLIPPLITFLPGAKITTGMIELASGAIVSGASRLISGLVDLLLLATAIVAAATVIDVPTRDLLDRPAPTLGPWTVVPSLVLVTLGYHLHRGARRGALPWILLVLAVAMAGERAASTTFSPSISAFFGAMAMTPLVMTIDRRPEVPAPWSCSSRRSTFSSRARRG